MIYFLNTRCSLQSLWLAQSFTFLLRWAWVGPTGVNWAGAIWEMEQIRLQTKTKKRVGTLVLCFPLGFLLCFYFVYLFFFFNFHIWNGTLGAGSSNQRWFSPYFFRRKPERGGTGRIPVLVPSVPPRKNWPLSLGGVESIEQPWEAKHNTGQTKVLAWDYSSSFSWHKELFHLHSTFPITFPAIQFNSCQAGYEGKKMMQNSQKVL